MKRKNVISILLISFIFSNVAAAGRLHYLNADAANFTSLPAPPAIGSPAAASDLAQVLTLQQSRTTADCARANHELSLAFADIFGAPLGPLTANEIQAGSKLYNQIKTDTNYFVVSIKNHWMRQRPYLESNQVKPCLPLEPSSSYPSGHATISRAEALVFAQIYPNKADALLARANEVGMDRAMGGVHHPADIQAGQALADLLFAKMQQNASFVAEINFERQNRR